MSSYTYSDEEDAVITILHTTPTAAGDTEKPSSVYRPPPHRCLALPDSDSDDDEGSPSVSLRGAGGARRAPRPPPFTPSVSSPISGAGRGEMWCRPSPTPLDLSAVLQEDCVVCSAATSPTDCSTPTVKRVLLRPRPPLPLPLIGFDAKMNSAGGSMRCADLPLRGRSDFSMSSSQVRLASGSLQSGRGTDATTPWL